MSSPLLAGFAEADFTPAPGLPLMGQMHTRIAQGTRDPLMACAAAFRQGETTVVLISLALAVLQAEQIRPLQAEWSRLTGLPESSLLIHTTHTHVAPSAVESPLAERSPEFLELVNKTVLQCAQDAVGKLEPVSLFAGCGRMDQMGWNRRAMFADGTSRMYSNSTMDGFIGMEGPRDPALPVIFARNEAGTIIGVLVSFATHPNCIESATVYSADLPGAARKYLQRVLGQDVAVVYLTGAAGNTAPSQLDPYDPRLPWRGDAGLERSGMYLAGEALKVIAETIEPMAEPVLAHSQSTFQIPIRDWPQPDDITWPNSWSGQWYYDQARPKWPQFQAENSPKELRVHAVRLGDAVILTNPAELFVEFGLELQSGSPAKVTMISELTDGCVGYVPTLKAFSRGGYETWCAPSSCLLPEAGDRIVAKTRELVNEVFSN